MATSQIASASKIEAGLHPFGGSEFEYAYTVINDSLNNPPNIRLFDIHFDPALFDEVSLTITSLPTTNNDWTQQLLSSAPGFDALFDVLAPGAGGVPPGQLASGFSVKFKWLGIGLPTSQKFDIYDPTTFELTESGTTALTTAVPLPASFSMIFTSVLLGLGYSKIRKKPQTLPTKVSER